MTRPAKGAIIACIPYCVFFTYYTVVLYRNNVLQRNVSESVAMAGAFFIQGVLFFGVIGYAVGRYLDRK